MSPPIRQMLDISTAHVSFDTSLWLEEQAELTHLNDEDRVLTVGDTGYGWFFYSGLDLEVSDIPDDLKAVATHARALGCDYVLLDRDADEIDELPTFVWLKT